VVLLGQHLLGIPGKVMNYGVFYFLLSYILLAGALAPGMLGPFTLIHNACSPFLFGHDA
jgi:hypothetical protein